jgi:hypothetical protein
MVGIRVGQGYGCRAKSSGIRVRLGGWRQASRTGAGHCRQAVGCLQAMPPCLPPAVQQPTRPACLQPCTRCARIRTPPLSFSIKTNPHPTRNHALRYIPHTTSSPFFEPGLRLLPSRSFPCLLHHPHRTIRTLPTAAAPCAAGHVPIQCPPASAPHPVSSILLCSFLAAPPGLAWPVPGLPPDLLEGQPAPATWSSASSTSLPAHLLEAVVASVHPLAEHVALLPAEQPPERRHHPRLPHHEGSADDTARVWRSARGAACPRAGQDGIP